MVHSTWLGTRIRSFPIRTSIASVAGGSVGFGAGAIVGVGAGAGVGAGTGAGAGSSIATSRLGCTAGVCLLVASGARVGCTPWLADQSACSRRRKVESAGLHVPLVGCGRRVGVGVGAGVDVGIGAGADGVFGGGPSSRRVVPGRRGWVRRRRNIASFDGRTTSARGSWLGPGKFGVYSHTSSRSRSMASSSSMVL